MMMTKDQAQLLEKTDAILTRSGYERLEQQKSFKGGDEPLSLEEDYDYDTGIPAGLNEAPMG